ncbi:MAG TPA: methyltransferase domain-containing protein [Candidatus Saccharimonadales bacterium]|nr:methyltransferase domain-containing protein [Candidatus Saccharimonadales bacterium]
MTEEDYDNEVNLADTSLTYGKIALHVPTGAAVLDIGCSGGKFGLALEAQRGCRVLGLEVSRAATARARARGLEVIRADVQTTPLESVLQGRRFDVVVLADVLEHLASPGRLLTQLPEILEPRGRVLVSIPNITHVDIQLMLAQDEWRYRPSGLLDHTHVRFFTLGSITELAFGCGFDVESVDPVVVPCLGTEVLDFGKQVVLTQEQIRAIQAVSETSNANSLTYQHVLQLVPAPERARSVAATADQAETAAVNATALPEPQVDLVVVTGPGRQDLAEILARSLGDQSRRSFQVTVVVQGGDGDSVGEFQAALGGLLVGTGPIRVVSSGPSRGAALNCGLGAATQEYVGFLADDESLSSEFLSRLVAQLEDRPELAAAYGSCRISRGEPRAGSWQELETLAVVGSEFRRADVVAWDSVALGSCLLRLQPVLSSGVLFPESPGAYPDWTFLKLLASGHEMAFVDLQLATAWVHSRSWPQLPGSWSADHERLVEQVAHNDAHLSVRMRAGEVRALRLELDRALRELEISRDASRTQLEEARAELGRVLLSRSWKLTRPLRRIKRSGLPE